MKDGHHICTVCNYIYEEIEHPKECGCTLDFNSLSDDWKCPECGTEKENFQPCSCVSLYEPCTKKKEAVNQNEYSFSNNKR
ncbi:MAG: rubredoxin [Cyanobacteria bacterium TGS_CYA1]|nr:rubredoxin [Cyanobacteria bacterium TGS_CYA1]